MRQLQELTHAGDMYNIVSGLPLEAWQMHMILILVGVTYHVTCCVQHQILRGCMQVFAMFCVCLHSMFACSALQLLLLMPKTCIACSSLEHSPCPFQKLGYPGLCRLDLGLGAGGDPS